MSDTVQLAVIAGIVTIATLIIKHFIDEHAKKAEAKRVAEAAVLAQKLEAVEVKMDGRLTELLEITKKAFLAEGKEQGKAEEQAKQIEIVQSTATLPDHPLTASDLKITGGEIKITTETKKKK